MQLLPEPLRRELDPSRIRDEVFTAEHAWTALAFVVAIASAAAGRTLLKSTWRATRGTDPPISPSAKEATWVESLVWGIVTGAIIGVVRAFARGGARSAQRRWS